MVDLRALGLFDTLVPIASILTISFLTVHILPKYDTLGLFLLVWWASSVFLSLQNNFFAEAGTWSSSDWRGMVVLLGFPALTIGLFFHSFRTQSQLRTFLFKDMPLWAYFALHVYRLDGLSLILPFWNGTIPRYLGIQMIILDVVVGATSIPLAWLAYAGQFDRLPSSVGGLDLVWFWNSLGLYDLVSAYGILMLNFFGMGGVRWVTEPAFSAVGFHPIPLIVLFQAPLAIAIHALLLTHMDVILQKQRLGFRNKAGLLPLHSITSPR